MTRIPSDFQESKQSAHHQLWGWEKALRIRRRKSEAGYVMVTAALSLFALLGLVGLAIDVGQLRLAKQKLQNAADAAAIAGGAEILFPDLTTAAKAASAANGFTNGTNGVTVTVSHPPADGPHSGNTNYVEVVVSQNQPTSFMGVMGVTSVPLSARAVASGTSPNCIYALQQGTNSLQIGLSIVTSACGIVGDGNLAGGLAILSASSIGLVGDNDCFLCLVTPNPSTHIPVASDPFASLPEPSPSFPSSASNCNSFPTGANPTIAQGTYGGAAGHPATITAAMGNVTFSGGTYIFCNGLSIQGGNVTFGAGTYVMYGGGFTMVGTYTGSLTGSGVLIYNTGTGTGGWAPYGAIQSYFTSGNSLIAPTSGPYAGILFFQDRANAQTANFDANFSVGTNPYLQGAYYFPDAQVNLDFDFGASAAYTILVADQVQWLLNFTFNNNYSSLPGGSSPVKNTGSLAE